MAEPQREWPVEAMSGRSSAGPDLEGYDVYIGFSVADGVWAADLARALSEMGIRCFGDLTLEGARTWRDALAAALRSSGMLVVLWSRDTQFSPYIDGEDELLESVLRGRTGSLIPVLLGDPAPASVPRVLGENRAILVDSEAYSAGPNKHPPGWLDAISQIAAAVRPQAESVSSASEAPVSITALDFSSGARRALTYASTMLGRVNRSPANVRTAALLGALRESAESNMTPTTGDVLRLVMSKQPDAPPVEVISAAAEVVGLSTLPEAPRRPRSIRDLAGSNVAGLVDEAADIARRTGATSVHLRHVLATGVHPDVEPEALSQLGVTLDDLRTEWRASIARTWPDESQEVWDDILRIARASGGAPPATPPSARVHADRWTIDDRLDYALYAKAIAEFIRHPDAKPPMVISVQGPWGQGKTSLMRMVQSDLDPGHPDLRDEQQMGADVADLQPSELTYGELQDALDGSVQIADTKPATARTVWFNAWKYQSSEQIWAGLAHAILSQLPARLPPKDRELFWLRLQLKRIDPAAVRSDIHKAILERFVPWAVALIAVLMAGAVLGAVALAGGFAGLGVASVAGGALTMLVAAPAAWLTLSHKVRSHPLEGAYLRYVRQPDYAGKLGYLHLVEEDMTRALELLTPDDQPTVIFIDDLDRCSPAKIGEVIEAVNLFLAGDYPNCAFVIGIDAEVVAASMEVLHEQIIEKLDDRRGELGWRFMDKFVQLPFVIPRLHPDQRNAYLRGLFATPPEHETEEIIAEAEQLRADVREQNLPVEELARRVGELAPRLAVVAPEQARALGEDVVTAGARSFSDKDPEVVQALAAQLRYLSDNPRTIKRAVNLYRFHRFAAFARQASTLPLEVATPEQIGRWIVVIIRWPHFVRWLQAQRDEVGETIQDPATRILALAAKSKTQPSFAKALAASAVDASWSSDEELWEFLRAEAPPELMIDLAASRGLW